MIQRPDNPYQPTDGSEPHPTWKRERDAFEQGMDTMYEAIMKARPNDNEIRIRIIEALYGATSVPELEEWLKEKLLLKP